MKEADKPCTEQLQPWSKPVADNIQVLQEPSDFLVPRVSVSFSNGEHTKNYTAGTSAAKINIQFIMLTWRWNEHHVLQASLRDLSADK